MRLFVKLFFAALPFLAVLVLYLVTDPFRLLYHYRCYYKPVGTAPVTLNKDWVSTQTFIRNYPIYHYDAYIFGNSRSMFYPVACWQQHIGHAHCFHFDASSEGLYGIMKKIQFLQARHAPIRQALLVLDAGLCRTIADQEGHLYRKHPALTGGGWLSFQWLFLRTFFDVHFITAYVYTLVTGRVRQQDVDAGMLNNVAFRYDCATNEVSFDPYEAAIARNADSFYAARRALFYPRPAVQVVDSPAIGPMQRSYFASIRSVFRAQGTHYRLVISPLYDQVAFNPADLAYLDSLFGSQNVYNFSGVNPITANCRSYYESSHYRPFVAAAILDSIYRKQ